MKIYYRQQNQDQEAITKRCLERLLTETEDPDMIEQWVNSGVSYADLSKFDFSNQCDSVIKMFEAKEVSYVIEVEGPYYYVGRVK